MATSFPSGWDLGDFLFFLPLGVFSFVQPMNMNYLYVLKSGGWEVVCGNVSIFTYKSFSQELLHPPPQLFLRERERTQTEKERVR